MKLQTAKLILLFFVIIKSASLSGQQVTSIKGKVFDSSTGEALFFVDLGFVGTYVGTNTDDNGNYLLESKFGSDSIYVAYLGYEMQKIRIKQGQKQEIDIKLVPESFVMESVTVIEKKQKYSKKNNPAIELARKITRNKKKNQLKGLPYYSYDQHEKVRLDMNNITEEFKNNRAVKKFDYVWDYIDTSEINGRTFLPLFFKETLSKIYYRQSDDKLREHREATKYTEFYKDWDSNSVSDIMTTLYQDIDIYEDDMSVIEMQFVSPLSTAGPDFYRYYIMDTLDYNGRSVIHLSFIPAVKGNRGFVGFLYVTNDDRYTVVKIDMGIVKNINVNFVRDLKIVQEFEPVDTNFVKTRDEVILDYSLTENGIGFYGTRSVSYNNFSFDKPEDESVFGGLENIIDSDSLLLRSDEYWGKNRIEELSNTELKTYELVNKLVDDKLYKAYVYLLNALSTGYMQAGPVEFGIIATFISFNDVEGRNLRIGGRTTYDLSKKLVFRGYLAHAQNTDLWKFTTTLEYTFNNRWKSNPRHYIRGGFERSSTFPGQELEFFSPDNFFLSFRRGRNTDMLVEDVFDLRYVHEGSGFNYTFGAQRRERNPYGTTVFNTTNELTGQIVNLEQINTTEIYTNLRYAPNEAYIQGKENRTQLYNEYPIIELRLTQGLPNVFKGDYQFTRAYLNIFKQIEWTRIGTTDILIEGGKTWGNVPYLIHFVPRGNQTYARFAKSYNMMNTLEFTTDQFTAMTIEHFSYGYLLNRIPLIKKLQLREILGFKILYGGLSDKNNPNENPDLVQFIKDDQGQSTTYTLDGTPYIEGSIGFSNIFKVLRLDLIQRFTHLDNPRIPTLFGQKGMGIRFSFQVEF